jgi:hypothetical protein
VPAAPVAPPADLPAPTAAPVASPAAPLAPPAAPGRATAWSGRATAASSALAGAGKAASEKASQLGGWLRRQSPVRIGSAAAAVVVVCLLVWMVASLGGGSKQPVADTSPAAPATTSAAPVKRGPLPLEGVGPLDFQPGDCFKDFDPEAPESTVVDCATGHSAQLIAVHHFEDSAGYPGLNALKDKGRETCRNAQLAAAATGYDLKQRNAYPSSTSWENGDRRVDCYVTADAGNVIMESLIP